MECDFDEVDRLADQVARLACDEPIGEDHVCQRPQFVITSELEASATAWRPELNL